MYRSISFCKLAPSGFYFYYLVVSYTLMSQIQLVVVYFMGFVLVFLSPFIQPLQAQQQNEEPKVFSRASENFKLIAPLGLLDDARADTILGGFEYAWDVYANTWKLNKPTFQKDNRITIQIKNGPKVGGSFRWGSEVDTPYFELVLVSHDGSLLPRYDLFTYIQLFFAFQYDYKPHQNFKHKWFKEATAVAAGHMVLEKKTGNPEFKALHYADQILKIFKEKELLLGEPTPGNLLIYFIQNKDSNRLKNILENFPENSTDMETLLNLLDPPPSDVAREGEVFSDATKEMSKDVFRQEDVKERATTLLNEFVVSLINSREYGVGTLTEAHSFDINKHIKNGLIGSYNSSGQFQPIKLVEGIPLMTAQVAQLKLKQEMKARLLESKMIEEDDSLFFSVSIDPPKKFVTKDNVLKGNTLIQGDEGSYHVDSYVNETEPMSFIMSAIMDKYSENSTVNVAGIIGEPPYLQKIEVKTEGNVIYHAEWIKGKDGTKTRTVHASNASVLKDKKHAVLHVTLKFSRHLADIPLCRVGGNFMFLKPSSDNGLSYEGEGEIDISGHETLPIQVEGHDKRGMQLNSHPEHKFGIQDFKMIGYVPGVDQNHEIRVGEKEVACENLIRLADEYAEKANAAGKAATDEVGRYIGELYNKPMPPRLATREAERQRAQAEWNKQEEEGLASDRQQNARNSNAFCYQTAASYLMILVVNVRNGQDELSNDEKKQCLERMKEVGGFYNQPLSKICPPTNEARAWCTPEKDAYPGGGLDICPSDISAICSYTKAQCDPS